MVTALRKYFNHSPAAIEGRFQSLIIVDQALYELCNVYSHSNIPSHPRLAFRGHLQHLVDGLATFFDQHEAPQLPALSSY